MPRTRNSFTYHSGVYSDYDSNGNLYESYPTPAIKDTDNWCQDESTNRGGNNPLIIDKFLNETNFNGQTYWANGKIHYVVTDWKPTWTAPVYQPTLKDITHAQVLIRTSPSKPKVDLPNFLYELKDLPGMAEEVMSFGKALPKTIQLIQNGMAQILKGRIPPSAQPKQLAGFNLSANFGWAPLVSDLDTLLRFSEDVNRRRNELERMRLHPITKRINIDSASETFAALATTVIYSNRIPFKGARTITRTAKRWASVRWSYNPDYAPRHPVTDMAAIRSLLGTDTLSAHNLWNALPWSFLVDYFTDMGDMFEATRNGMTQTPSHACIMTHTKHVESFLLVTIEPLVGARGTGTITREVKQRLPLNGLLSPSFSPFLSGKQVSILGSLAIAKRNAWQ